MAIKVCVILKYLHSLDNPVFYCDLKPGNLLMDDDGEIKLVDFSLSRLKTGDEIIHGTITGGTVGYAPPEQFSSGSVVNEKSDIFAVGTLLYYLLSGKKPPADFSSSGASRTDVSGAIGNIASEQLLFIINKCLGIEKKQQYDNISDLEQDLQYVFQGKKIPTGFRSRKKNRYYAAVIFLGLIITISSLLAFSSVFSLYIVPSRLASPEYPVVISETKSNESFDVNSDKIVLKFSQPMDTDSVREALQINAHKPKTIIWSNNDTRCEIPLTNDNVFASMPLFLTIDIRIAQDKKNRMLGFGNQHGFEKYLNCKLAMVYGKYQP
jgi:serine/threonine protein kinase